MAFEPIDPNDPTEQPLLLIPTDVITVNPETGEPGDWTFVKARDLGLQVELDCMTAKGHDKRFEVPRSARIHIQPRGNSSFWGAA